MLTKTGFESRQIGLIKQLHLNYSHFWFNLYQTKPALWFANIPKNIQATQLQIE